jgi:hypothetical protein
MKIPKLSVKLPILTCWYIRKQHRHNKKFLQCLSPSSPTNLEGAQASPDCPSSKNKL